MTRVLVVWEDTFYQPLAGILNRAVRKLAPGADASHPTVLNHTARSNTAFGRYVDTTWPSASARGLPVDPGPIDHVICVVDADKLSGLLPQAIPSPPNHADQVATWHVAAEHAWHSHLRGRCPQAGPPASSVHGVVLRWSKESVLLSGYDQPAFGKHLECDMTVPEVVQLLKSCKPALDRIEARRFSDSYRHPVQCLKALRTTVKLAALPKNAPQIDDALRTLGRESLDKICERTPDIARVAELVWSLHATSQAPPAAISP